VFSDDKKTDETSFNLNSNIQHHREETSQGRFPANFIMTHHPDCKCIGIKKVGSGKLGGYNYEGNVYDVDGFVPNNSPVANSNYGEEIVEDWNCHEDCPIKIMDEQSGISKSSDAKRNRNTIGSFGMPNDNTNEYNDKGGASRFFYIAKASKWERNFGLDDFEDKRFSAYGYDVGLGEKAEGMFKDRNPIKKNIHPTVKPIKLMQYLVRMITPPNGIVLDPFAGSGTTGIACKIDGFNFVGLELSEEYTEIAKQRIDSFVEENVFIDETIIYKLRDKDEDDNNESNQLSLF
jgi:adenine specific DNA methylase Mod